MVFPDVIVQSLLSCCIYIYIYIYVFLRNSDYYYYYYYYITIAKNLLFTLRYCLF